MPTNASSIQGLRKLFQDGFTVQDVAEPLISVDGDFSAERLREFMEQRRLEVVGIRSDGIVVGFANRSDLRTGPAGESLHRFDDSQVVSDSLPLGELILLLKEHRRLFVSLLGQVGGIVSRSDLQKPAVRMWLFGIVTLTEMRFTRLIESVLPDEQWKPLLSEGRIQKAGRLLAERAKRDQELNLLDCLQLSDKAQIVARHETLRQMTQFDTKSQLERVTKMLENLRNSLAHSQDILSNDWETVVMLAENLDALLERSVDRRREDSQF